MASALHGSSGDCQHRQAALQQVSQNLAPKAAPQAEQARINTKAQHTSQINNSFLPFTLRRLTFCDVQKCLRALSDARHNQYPTRVGFSHARLKISELCTVTDYAQHFNIDSQSPLAIRNTIPELISTENSVEPASRPARSDRTNTPYANTKQNQNDTAADSTPNTNSMGTTREPTRISSRLRHHQNHKQQHFTLHAMGAPTRPQEANNQPRPHTTPLSQLRDEAAIDSTYHLIPPHPHRRAATNQASQKRMHRSSFQSLRYVPMLISIKACKHLIYMSILVNNLETKIALRTLEHSDHMEFALSSGAGYSSHGALTLP
jgi:hypothetical protein